MDRLDAEMQYIVERWEGKIEVTEAVVADKINPHYHSESSIGKLYGYLGNDLTKWGIVYHAIHER